MRLGIGHFEIAHKTCMAGRRFGFLRVHSHTVSFAIKPIGLVCISENLTIS